MLYGYKFKYDCGPYFLYRNHYCLYCQSLLIRKKREKIVHSQSEEVKYYDFSAGDTYMLGNVKFITYYFECPDCKYLYEIKELKRLERFKRMVRRADGFIKRYDCSMYFLNKKHYCHNCNNILIRKRREKIVNSQSEEAKNYDFLAADYLGGNVNIITYYFKCSGCKNIYEIKELKKIEKRKREK